MLGSAAGVKLRLRWEAELARNNASEFGMTLSRGQYNAEWADELDSIRAPDVSLGAIHVMALAQVLRRPVIVFAQPFVRGALGEIMRVLLFLMEVEQQRVSSRLWCHGLYTSPATVCTRSQPCMCGAIHIRVCTCMLSAMHVQSSGEYHILVWGLASAKLK